MSFLIRAGAAAGLLAAACGPASAQSEALKTVVVPGSSGDSPTEAAASLAGTGLLLRQQSSLGETMSSLPGVSSTYFGPAASRPVVRGLDGDRVRILDNGGALRDASSVSYDHAVATDPLAVDRIELLRGPAALLYGSGAPGGVVNLVDGRIPREPTEGVSGRADVGVASGARDRNGAVVVEGGSSRLGLHVDAFDRRSGEVRVPLALPCTQGGVSSTSKRLCNSDAKSRGGAVGASLFFDRGYFGLSVASSDSEYGSVAEGDVRLAMRTQRVGFEGQWRAPLPGLESLKVQGSSGRYRHTEFDAGVAGTTFRNDGRDVRVEARHAPIGPLKGVVGFQAESSDFSAVGTEAFVPPSTTRQRALFLLEEWTTGPLRWSGALRRDSVDVATPGDPLLARFAPAQRKFAPGSASLSAAWDVAKAWEATTTLSRTSRAPKSDELFANGPHVATGAYEVGDATLRTERATTGEVALQWKSDANRLRVSAWQSRFRDYVALLGTGRLRDSDGNGAAVSVADCGDGTSVESGCTAQVMPEFAWRSVAARLRGLEAEGSIRLLRGEQTLDLELRGDLLRADNLTLGQPLPRIAPARAGATLAWQQGAWGARLGFDAYARQSRVPAGDQPVAGYTLWNAAVTYKVKAGPADLLAYLRVDNLGDRAAFSATSILTQSLPGRVPLPGRSVKVGMRADF